MSHITPIGISRSQWSTEFMRAVVTAQSTLFSGQLSTRGVIAFLALVSILRGYGSHA